MRICSFLPSATEMLFELGAGDQVCGVTCDCDWPVEAALRPRVVSTHLPPGLQPGEIDAIVTAEGAQGRSLYFVDLPRLEDLQPDLVVLQDLCQVCAIDSLTLARDMSRLGSQPQVLSLSGQNLEGVFADIERLGAATGCSDAARRLNERLRARVEAVRAQTAAGTRPRVLCLEWLDPPFQGGHWIPEMVEVAGGQAVLARPGEKSVRLQWDQAIESDPEIVVLMPCGYHLDETIEQYRTLLAEDGVLPAEWKHTSAHSAGQIYAVDGSAYFSRPGPRLVDGLEILHAILSGRNFETLPPASVARVESC